MVMTKSQSLIHLDSVIVKMMTLFQRITYTFKTWSKLWKRTHRASLSFLFALKLSRGQTQGKAVFLPILALSCTKFWSTFYRFKFMLFQLDNTFGKQFWNNVVLEITKYGYNDNDLSDREGDQKKTEEYMTQNWNEYFKDNFKLTVRLLFLVVLICPPKLYIFSMIYQQSSLILSTEMILNFQRKSLKSTQKNFGKSPMNCIPTMSLMSKPCKMNWQRKTRRLLTWLKNWVFVMI